MVIGTCDGDQIYDTSTCIDCNAECVSASQDPQGRGQFIERECLQTSEDFVCRPCSASCPVGTFVSNRCSGRGRTDTGCTLCRAFCKEALAGVPGAHGQYIAGYCDGYSTADLQSCRDCKLCPAGHYPTGLCSGVDFVDTVECVPCITECPAGFYLRGDCRVEEVTCVPCDAPCGMQSPFLQEKQGCANGLNRVCEPNTKCKDASCPEGYYESATCTDPEGPKFCSPCQTCSLGQYQSTLCSSQHDRACTDCTSECPDALNYIGIIGECATGFDTMDAVMCVPAAVQSRRRNLAASGNDSTDATLSAQSPRRNLAASGNDSMDATLFAQSPRRNLPTSANASAGTTLFGTCGANEWYVGTRTPMFIGAVARDAAVPGSDAFGLAPFKSDFSPRTFDTIVYLGTEPSGSSLVSVFARASPGGVHHLLTLIRPWENFYDRLDARGGAAGRDPMFPISTTTAWNAVDVMLSHNETSVYVFFSYTYDFIGMCSLQGALAHRQNASSQLPHATTPNDCTYLSPRTIFPTRDTPSIASVTLKGCTRMHPFPHLACLYDLDSSKAVLYAVDELTGAKTLLDNRTMAYNANGIFLHRPKSPPTWDPVNQRIFYITDLEGTSTGSREMVLRVVRVARSAPAAHWSASSSSVLWRGSSGDSANYHSLVYTVRSGSTQAASIMAVCMPPSCPQALTLVAFSSDKGFLQRSVATAFQQQSTLTFDVGIRWYWAEAAGGETLFVGQQIYMLSRADRRWGLWTQCAPCPANSYSPAGSVSSADSGGGAGIDACKCIENFFGVLQRPVVDACQACRIRFESDGVTLKPESLFTTCLDGQYRTNVPCSPLNPDRSVDSTCAMCRDSCRPGDVSTAFAGEYISKRCDGTGFDASVQCQPCAASCDRDDAYMQFDVVCTGRDEYDTRLQQACRPCRTQCPAGYYVHNRCLGEGSPASDNTTCLPCSPCENGQYVSRQCNGSTFWDARECASCRYGSNKTSGQPSRALEACPLQNSFVLNECLDGLSTLDETACSTCNRNCRAANYSSGENGQYIRELCNSLDQRDSVCEKCSGRCVPYAEGVHPGQFIVGFCTGMTQFDRSCADCRVACLPGQYIAGDPCSGESDRDTTRCEACTPMPQAEEAYYVQNPCTGETRTDQAWLRCAESCAPGEYISRECTMASPAQCTPCRRSCPAGYYISGSACDGTSKYDTVACIKCKDCQEGQYKSATCSGNLTVDTVECTNCGQQCTAGQYIFASCSGTQDFDETSCKECTVCERDFPNAYNSIAGSCGSGTDAQDAVACALNEAEFAFPGDMCPAGYYTPNDVLKRIDAQFRREVVESIRAAARLQADDLVQVQLEYEALVPMPQSATAHHELLPGHVLMVSTTAMLINTSLDQRIDLASATGLEYFQASVC